MCCGAELQLVYIVISKCDPWFKQGNADAQVETGRLFIVQSGLPSILLFFLVQDKNLVWGSAFCVPTAD